MHWTLYEVFYFGESSRMGNNTTLDRISVKHHLLFACRSDTFSGIVWAWASYYFSFRVGRCCKWFSREVQAEERWRFGATSEQLVQGSNTYETICWRSSNGFAFGSWGLGICEAQVLQADFPQFAPPPQTPPEVLWSLSSAERIGYVAYKLDHPTDA